MKYKELERVAIESCYSIKRIGINTIIEKKRNGYISTIIIKENQKGKIIIDAEISYPHESEVVKAAVEYANTPLDERQEEKKYYLRHKFMCGFEKDTFLNVDDLNRAVYLGNNAQSSSIQTQFTQEEIDEIKKKYNTDLKDFEIIEVEE